MPKTREKPSILSSIRAFLRPFSREFARKTRVLLPAPKDKPLTLLSGGELLSLLAVNEHRAKTDQQEAKALNLL
jgi:hypothetical protein